MQLHLSLLFSDLFALPWSGSRPARDLRSADPAVESAGRPAPEPARHAWPAAGPSTTSVHDRTSWKSTAEIYADPELFARLGQPGDDAIPAPFPLSSNVATSADR
jgi:hypothetical protein